jgi:hypothetical protein
LIPGMDGHLQRKSSAWIAIDEVEETGIVANVRRSCD